MGKKQQADLSKKKIVKTISLNEPWYLKQSIPVLIILIMLVYARSISLGFTYLDDTIFMLDKGESNEHLSNIFSAFVQGTFSEKDIYYRPLFRITFILERQILFLFPIEKFIDYALPLAHIVNLMLHILSITLLFRVLQKFSFSKQSALMWSAVYAVHPVLTMAVAWIPGRNDLMLSVFLLAYFLHFFSYIETKKTKHIIWQAVFLLLALLTKETAVFIPFAAAFYLLVFRRKELLSKMWLVIYPVWIIEIIIWYVLRSYTIDLKQANQSLADTVSTALERVPGLIQYIGKIFLPFNLTVYPTVADTTYLFGAIAIVALIILIALNKNRNWKMILFGAGWFVLFILPFFFVPKKINDALFEHRLYIPMIGMIFITAQALPFILRLIQFRSIIIYGCIIVIFSGMTIYYMVFFKDEISFYRKAVADAPSSAYMTKMLGIRLNDHGNETEAITYFKKAFAMDSTQMYTHYFLAKLIYLKEDSLSRAKSLLEQELKYTPTYVDNYFQLAYIGFKQNDNAAVIKNLKKVIELVPDDKASNNNLLKTYIDTKNKKAALDQISYMNSKGIFVDDVTISQVNALPKN